MKKKKCKACGKLKSLVGFGIARRCKDGRRGDCKKCLSEKQMARENRDQKIVYLSLYYRQNKSKYRVYAEIGRDKKNEARRNRYATDKQFREKAKRDAKEWQKKNPHKRKAQRLKKYGITQNEFIVLMDRADNQCEICGCSDISDKNNFPVIDHSHATNRVRGILCGRCNKGIGLLCDDPVLLLKAAGYLENR